MLKCIIINLDNDSIVYSGYCKLLEVYLILARQDNIERLSVNLYTLETGERIPFVL